MSKSFRVSNVFQTEVLNSYDGNNFITIFLKKLRLDKRNIDTGSVRSQFFINGCWEALSEDATIVSLLKLRPRLAPRPEQCKLLIKTPLNQCQLNKVYDHCF